MTSTLLARKVCSLVIVLVALLVPSAAQAQPFLGEIRWVGFNFAPVGWARCDGQLLSIAQNTALFSLLGTMYGGNGQTTFALPDMRGRVPVHVGMGPGLTSRVQGEVGGTEAHALTVNEMPAHDHGLTAHAHDIPALTLDVRASSAAATSNTAAGNVLATTSVTGRGNPNATSIYAPGTADVSLGASGTTVPSVTTGATAMTSPTGGSAPHENMQPFVTVQCIIAVQGIFPSRQ